VNSTAPNIVLIAATQENLTLSTSCVLPFVKAELRGGDAFAQLLTSAKPNPH